jgi:hypothetical protein
MDSLGGLPKASRQKMQQKNAEVGGGGEWNAQSRTGLSALQPVSLQCNLQTGVEAESGDTPEKKLLLFAT